MLAAAVQQHVIWTSVHLMRKQETCWSSFRHFQKWGSCLFGHEAISSKIYSCACQSDPIPMSHYLEIKILIATIYDGNNLCTWFTFDTRYNNPGNMPNIGLLIDLHFSDSMILGMEKVSFLIISLKTTVGSLDWPVNNPVWKRRC